MFYLNILAKISEQLILDVLEYNLHNLNIIFSCFAFPLQRDIKVVKRKV